MCYRADITNQTTWTINIGTKTRTCATKIFIRRSQSNLSAKASRLSLALLFWAATRIYLTGMMDLVKNLSQMNWYVHIQFLSYFWKKSTTFSIILGNFLIVVPSSLKFGTCLSSLQGFFGRNRMHSNIVQYEKLETTYL